MSLSNRERVALLRRVRSRRDGRGLEAPASFHLRRDAFLIRQMPPDRRAEHVGEANSHAHRQHNDGRIAKECARSARAGQPLALVDWCGDRRYAPNHPVSENLMVQPGDFSIVSGLDSREE